MNRLMRFGWQPLLAAAFVFLFIRMSAYVLQVPFETMNDATWYFIQLGLMVGFTAGMIFTVIKEPYQVWFFGGLICGTIVAGILGFGNAAVFIFSPEWEYLVLTSGITVIWYLLTLWLIYWVICIFIKK